LAALSPSPSNNRILFPNVGTPTISAGGNGSGFNGSVVVVTGGSNGITLPNGISDSGGTSGTGSIALSTAEPTFPTSVVISRSTGGVTSGSFLTGTTPQGGISVGPMSLGGGPLSIAQVGTVNLNSTLLSGPVSNLLIQTSGDINISTAINANTVTLASGGNI